MPKVVDNTQTIAAISTPPGAGGIGIIRISGDKALDILVTIFKPLKKNCEYTSHQLYYGNIVDPVQSRIVDEVLAVYMRAPATYTREDVVEIHCHGSYLILHSVLELIIGHGAVLAEPGEFTKRAFLNGRIDLTKAEAVIDILSAKTKKGVDLAQEQLAGALYNRIDSIRKMLVHIRAVLEVSIDFPDEDVDIVDHSGHSNTLVQDVIPQLEKLLKSADQGKVMREGVTVVIAGQPNVGKSSLLNTLLQEERALVTAIPGTTRDTIEEYVDINGMPVRLVDTAGIRENADLVEELGIKRARDIINIADLVLFLFDGAEGVSARDLELFETVAHKPLILVQNKLDVAAGKAVLPEAMVILPLVMISARHQQGIDELKDTIFSKVISGDGQWQEEGCVPNLRHKKALAKALDAAKRLNEGFVFGGTSDLLAIDLQECLDYLGDIVGETTTEDVLDVIFEQFCLGK